MKYEVEVTNTRTYTATIEIDAVDEDDATKQAEKIAEADIKRTESMQEQTWTEEDNYAEVVDVTQIDDED